MYENYAKIRDSLGLKDADVTRMTGIATSTMSEWKSGKHAPSAEKILAIATALNVSTDAIMRGAEFQPSESDAERQMLAVFRRLSGDDKATLIRLAVALPSYSAGKKLSDSASA